MKSIAKTILLLVGVGLLLYGVYIFIRPEASLDVLGMSFEEQDNSYAYITIGIGLVITLAGGFLSRKR